MLHCFSCFAGSTVVFVPFYTGSFHPASIIFFAVVPAAVQQIKDTSQTLPSLPINFSSLKKN
jgi:hypothetical protein